MKQFFRILLCCYLLLSVSIISVYASNLLEEEDFEYVTVTATLDMSDALDLMRGRVNGLIKRERNANIPKIWKLSEYKKRRELIAKRNDMINELDELKEIIDSADESTKSDPTSCNQFTLLLEQSLKKVSSKEGVPKDHVVEMICNKHLKELEKFYRYFEDLCN